jgi:hypothetical protein
MLLLGIAPLPAFGSSPVKNTDAAQSAAVRVDTQRVMGVTIGLRREDTLALRQEASDAALRQVQALASVYDMLVGVTFLSRPSAGKLTLDTAGLSGRGEGDGVRVSGVSPMAGQGKIEDDSALWDEFSTPADSPTSFAAAPTCRDSLPAQAAGGLAPQDPGPAQGAPPAQEAALEREATPIWEPAARAKKLGVSYLALKYRVADNFSGIGVEYDYLKQLNPYHLSGYYLGGSFNVSLDNRSEIGGGLSAGWPIEVLSGLQVITGGSVGYWSFDARNRYWGSHETYFAVGGPFVRLLIGNGGHWLDISDRLLFGDRALNQIMLGYTFTWARGEQF